jgi:hypothetical protein
MAEMNLGLDVEAKSRNGKSGSVDGVLQKTTSARLRLS